MNRLKDRQTPSKLLNIIEGLRQFRSFYGANLLGVRLDASAGHQEAKQFSCWDTEGTLGWIQFDSEPSQIGECFTEIIEQGSALFHLDDDIVHVHLHIFANLIVQAFLHTPLVSCPGIP